jgi:hypothetical protein
LECLPELFKKELVWFRTDGLGAEAFQTRREGSETSWCNPVETNAIIDLLRRLDEHQPFIEWLTKQTYDQNPIGIICTYAQQADLIRRRLDSVGISGVLRSACKIDTVDSYQGKENAIVFLTLVRNNADGRDEFSHTTIAQGFMARGNRINVALSRARDRLVIVGAFNRWPAGSPMERVAATVSRLADEGLAVLMDVAELSLQESPSASRRSGTNEASKTETMETAP